MAGEDNIFSNEGGTIFGNEKAMGSEHHRRRISDTDIRPGGAENSISYDKRYNPQGENEYTNLPENANQIEEKQFLRRQREYELSQREDLREALTRVQYWPYAGRFIIPKENTYAAHLSLVRQGNTVDIHFDPKTYLYFDKVIADQAKRPEIFDPRHRDYAKFETLRENLAVLRNDIMGIYMNDASFDPGDEKYFPKLVQIANEIGDALHIGNRVDRVLFPSLDADLVNIEGEGAATLYEFVQSRQTPNTIIGKVLAFIRYMLGQPDNKWDLPPIETTAFSIEGLSGLPPQDALCQCSSRDMNMRAADIAADQLEQLKADTQRATVDDIRHHQRMEAVKHGHKILDWLRNIQFSDKSVQDYVNTGNPDQTAAERDAMNMLIDAYYEIAGDAFAQNPTLFNQPKMQAANDALETLEHALELMAKLEKPKSLADTMQISTDETQQPDKWNELSKNTVNRLMDTLKGGLEEAVSVMEGQAQAYEQQQEEMADRQVESALASHAAFAKGRKKRKAAVSGKGGVKQEKLRQAITADDYALGQGVHAGRADKSRDGIVDSSQRPARSQRQVNRERMPVRDSLMNGMVSQVLTQDKQVTSQSPSPLKSDFSAIPGINKIGKDLFKMQKESQEAAANLPPEAVKAVNEQTKTQRVTDSKTRNNNRPKIG